MSPRRRSASGCAHWRSRPAGSCWCGPNRCRSPSPARRCCASPVSSSCSPPTSPASWAARTPGPAHAADRRQRRLDGDLGAPRAGAAGRRRLLRPAPRGPGAHQRPAARRHRHGGGDRGGRAGARLHVTRLGSMRYRPMATPAFVGQWFPAGPTPEALARAPVVVFDRKDDLQHRYLTAGRRRRRPTGPLRPASADYRRRGRPRPGMGHGPRPAGERPRGARTGRADPAGAVDVVLYWQQWRLRSDSLDRVREAVLAAAARELD